VIGLADADTARLCESPRIHAITAALFKQAPGLEWYVARHPTDALFCPSGKEDDEIGRNITVAIWS
jgi:hypothetical protein